MRRVLVLLLLAAASACGPAPAPMSATRASELLERFAAGAGAADVCTPAGRAMLRGAVRAYGSAMREGGVAWPALPAADAAPSRMDVSVLVAFAGGFVEASDFQGAARGALTQLSFERWPEISGMRDAARVACADVVSLQQAAARLVLESERLRWMRGERADRQRQRVERAEAAMQQMAAAVAVRVEAAREG